MAEYIPLVGVSADRKLIDGSPFHAVGEKYLAAITDVSQAVPLILPALSSRYEVPALLAHLDGIFLTGSPSNLHPRHYGEAPSQEHEPYDEHRDELTLLLIRECLAQAIPLIAVCRGFQELNAALGGTLHPAVHELPGRLDHRRPDSPDPEVQYGPQHTVHFRDDGEFYRRFGMTEISVNSLHRQAIQTLAPDLQAEATAPDGTIEAVSVRNAPGFALGVQWHPEYQATERPFSRAFFGAFGEALRARARARRA